MVPSIDGKKVIIASNWGETSSDAQISAYVIETCPGVSSITPTESSPLSGDANGDGRVDELDYVIWRDNYNLFNRNGFAQGDFNGDNKADGLDYTIWLNNYS